jgi:membrane fusion protein (multidrug efflux system)
MAAAEKTGPSGTRQPRATGRIVGRLALVVALAGGLALLLLVLAGVFRAKVPTEPPAVPQTSPADLPLAEVRLLRRPRFETAVGTVRAVHEVAVASKLLARITEVRVKAGQPVTRDEVLVRLDDNDLRARLKQAEAAATAAVAAREGAEADLARAKALLPSGGISKEEAQRRETAVRTTTADLERAQEAVREAKVLLDFATIRSPLTGIVIDKRVEAGDTAVPGQVLLTLFNPQHMQMVVTVRESLAQRLAVGQKVRGQLDALDRECQATVSEIVPEAQAASRSFTVKVTGPCPPGAYSGMFGRIFIPLGEEEIVAVPAAAVEHVGQLDMVRVVAGREVQRRNVQLGRRIGEDYEVLAGLKPAELVVLTRAKGKEVQP